MKRFGYEFPCEPTAANLDTATEGYRKFYDGVNRACRSTSADGVQDNSYAQRLLSELRVDWHGVLRFLCSMHGSGTRNTHRGWIENVAAKLDAFSPEFRAAVAEQGGLPWRAGRAPSASIDVGAAA